MASFSVDTNVSSTLSLPSAVSASVIHDDGGDIYAFFDLVGFGNAAESQFWPGKDFGYSYDSWSTLYTNQNEEARYFIGLMGTLEICYKNIMWISLYELPTYVVRGAKKGSSRSTLFSQTAYLLEEVMVGVG